MALVVKNLPAYAGDRKETLVLSLGQEDPQEEGLAIIPVFLPGESLWTEEPGRLQSIDSQSQT